jgi:hypothetical protein
VSRFSDRHIKTLLFGMAIVGEDCVFMQKANASVVVIPVQNL